MATVRIPTPLRKLTQGKEEVSAQGATIGALIASLEKQYPGLKERICDDNGTGAPLREHLRERRGHPLPQGPRHPVKDADEISIVPAIAGGVASTAGP